MKAAIYSRKSKFTGKGESIENQITICKEYGDKINDSEKGKVTEYFIYEDEGFSGKNTLRPEFQRMMADAKAKKFDILICYKLDRVSRSVADFSTLIQELQNFDIGFISVRDNFDTTSAMGRAMMYISSVFAQLERETIAERVRDNMMELAKTGRWLGGVTPIGYDAEAISFIDEDLKERKLVKLKQNPEELELVKLIFAKYLELKSLSKVETYLLQNSYKTKANKEFAKTKIKIILNNCVYVKSTKEVLDYLQMQDISVSGEPDGIHGILSYNKSKGVTTESGKIARVARDTEEWIAAVSSHKGIISAEDWIKVQELLKENREKVPRLGKTHNAILTGILRCGKCGGNMRISHGHLSRVTGEKFYYYTCSMKSLSRKSRCDNKNVKVDEIEEAVFSRLKDLALNKKSFLENIKEQRKKAAAEAKPVNRAETLKKTLNEKLKQIDTLADKLSRDEDLDEVLIPKIKSLKKEAKEIEENIKNIKEGISRFDAEEIELSIIESLLERCSVIDTLSSEEKKMITEVLIKSILWNSDDGSIEINYLGAGKKN